jgi:uncharacterized phage protein (TIGR02218 family)
MRTVTTALAAHLKQESTTLATCWRVQLTDGTTLGFTDHDADLVVGGWRYLAATGYTASAVETSAALNVDNLDVEGMLESPSITEEDLQAGRWDYARIEIFMVNWTAPDAGKLVQRVGTLGEVSAEGSRFRAEIRGLMQALQQSIGELYGPSCRADFGDARCKFDLSTVTTLALVASSSADGRTLYCEELVQPAGFYDGGKATFIDGANAGIVCEIKTNEPGSITLQLPPPYPPEVGARLEAVAGCLKRFIEDCHDRYSNTLNFRGEPHLPGINKVSARP